MSLKLLKVGLLCAALGLTACPSNNDGGTTSPTSGNTPSTTTVPANTGTVTVTTAPNNVVTIGASGTNFKVADAAGKAVFTGLPAGAVDVHVFSADGYSATSYMGMNAASIVNFDAGATAGSVIDVYVQVANPSLSGQNIYLKTADNIYFGFGFAFGTGIATASIDVSDKPVGSTVSGTLYIGQGVPVSTAGNVAAGDTEVLNLGTQSFTTTALGAAGTTPTNLTANFVATPPVPAPLVTLSAVTLPVGLSVDYAGFGSAAAILPTAAGAGLVLPDTLKALPFGSDTSWFVSASDATGNQSWDYFGTFAVGGTVSATASITTMSTIAANQTGNVISWTNATGALTLNSIDIYDPASGNGWSILTAGGVSSITLPTVPAVATSPLVAGSPYMIDVFSLKDASGGSYEQAFVFFTSANKFTNVEIISVSNTAYMR